MTMTFESLHTREQALLCPTYDRYPLEISRGQGTRLYAPNGFQYTDLLAGIAVCVLGHSHPEIAAVLREQGETLLHVSNLFYQEPQLKLARRLLAGSGLDRAFFCNSGAEANEAALKIARRYMQVIRGLEAFEIITLDGSFHGRTLATLTATGQAKVKEGFAPLPAGFRTVPFADIAALESALTSQTAAVLLEVIQGEGGVRMLPGEYLEQVQTLCRRHGCLFMIDEVQTGLGRTGKRWAYQHYNLQPDVLTTAKGLANGLPLGAMLTTEAVSRAFSPGSHGSTFGGGPLVCAVGDKVLEIIDRDDLARHAQEVGDLALERFRSLQARFPEMIADIRGKGLMLGIELQMPAKAIWRQLLDKGFICNVVQETTLRLLPPLIISIREILDFADALEQILTKNKDAVYA